MSSQRPGAIVFDWDNTLVDSWSIIHDALNVTFARMGLPAWTLAETKVRTRLSLREAFPKLFGERWTEAQKIYLDSFESMHIARLAPIEGAADALERISSAGPYLAVVSNKTGRVLRREVEALGWTGYFVQVIGAGDAAQDKPARDPVDMALTGYSRQASRPVWYVGDTGLDLICARNADCIGVLLSPDEEEKLDEAGLAVPEPHHHFSSWLELVRSFEAFERC